MNLVSFCFIFSHVWECLAEAYYHRGSYTAALKAFSKASEVLTSGTVAVLRHRAHYAHMGESFQDYS